MDGVPFLFNYPPAPAPHIHIDAPPDSTKNPDSTSYRGFTHFESEVYFLP